MKHKDFEKIRTLFDTAFSEKKTLCSLRKYEDNPRMVASNYMVYSFTALPLLIEKMKQLDTWDSRSVYSARFVVEANGNCWFALEGPPGDTVDYLERRPRDVVEQNPAHSDMTPSKTCISSGIIVFSEEYQIEKITNFSGHYRPEPGTLVWIIASLLRLGADFTPNLELMFFWKKGNSLRKKTVPLLREDLHTLLPEQCVVTPNTDHRVGVVSSAEWIYFGADKVPEFKRPERALKRPHMDDRGMHSPVQDLSESKPLFSGHTAASSYESPKSSKKASLRIEIQPFSDDDYDDDCDEKINPSMHSPRTMTNQHSFFSADKLYESPETKKSVSPQIKLNDHEPDAKSNPRIMHSPITTTNQRSLFGPGKFYQPSETKKSASPQIELNHHEPDAKSNPRIMHSLITTTNQRSLFGPGNLHKPSEAKKSGASQVEKARSLIDHERDTKNNSPFELG